MAFLVLPGCDGAVGRCRHVEEVVMPAVFWERGFKFHFYSSEGDPLEPVHIHVAKRGGGDARLWLYPEVTFAYNRGFDARTQGWIIRLVEDRRAEIESAWNEHFGSGD